MIFIRNIRVGGCGGNILIRRPPRGLGVWEPFPEIEYHTLPLPLGKSRICQVARENHEKYAKMWKNVEKCQKNEKSTKKRRKKFENAQNQGKKGPLRQTDQNLNKNLKKIGAFPASPRQPPPGSPPVPASLGPNLGPMGPIWAQFGPQWVPMGPNRSKYNKKTYKNLGKPIKT